MTIQEKLTLQSNDCKNCYLFKEGMFYKVYNEGAFMFQEISKYKVNAKYLKVVNTTVYSMGFPQSVLNKFRIPASSKNTFGILDSSLLTLP